MSNDALFVDTAEEGAQAGLLALMAGISEELYCAGWMNCLEFDLWAIMQGTRSPDYGMGVVTERQRALLRLLSEEAGGWWTDAGEKFERTEQWLKRFSDPRFPAQEKQP